MGVATAFMLATLDQSIKQVEEIKQITKLPLLGVIPKVAEPRIDANIHTSKKVLFLLFFFYRRVALFGDESTLPDDR